LGRQFDLATLSLTTDPVSSRYGWIYIPRSNTQ